MRSFRVRRYPWRKAGLALASGPGRECTGPTRAVKRAIGIAGADAVRVVLLGDRRHADRILEGLGTDPPPEAVLRVAARPGLVVADATGAGERSLRRLARALPRRRPMDGIGYVVGLDGEGEGKGEGEDGGAEHAARLARRLGFRAALHLVIPGESAHPIFEPCPDPAVPDAHALARGLQERLVHAWLHGAGRPDLGRTTADPDTPLEVRVEAAIGRSRSESLVVSSLAWGGQGLAAAVESTADRTEPLDLHARRGWAGSAALAAGIVLGALGGFTQAERAAGLGQALSVLAPVLPGARADPGALAGEAKARRYARAAAALERAAGPSVSSPLSGLHPGSAALRTLARRAVTDVIVRPARTVVRERIARDLGPGADPDEWLGRAGALLAGTGRRESSGAAALVAAAYDSSEERWRRYLAHATRRIPAAPAPPSEEIEGGFARTMTAWSRNRYTKSSLLAHARRAAGATGWRARMTALRAMETALGAGEGRWLSSGGSDPGLERILARARGVLDEKTVERGRAAASRAEQAARVEIEGLRLGGAYRLVDLAGDEGPALAAAARRLLRALEAFASEDLLASDGARSRSVAATGFTARSLLASLKRLDRRLAETGVDRGLREWLRVEIETAAFDEAADRIEAATLGSFVAEERAAIREIERLARAKGSYRAAIRIGSVRARLEEATSRAALRAIEEEDPLALEFDAGTDRHAVLDRVVAGIERLDTLHREEVEFGGFEWEELGRTLRGYRTGDRSSALTRMVERAGDYARRGTSGCGEPLQGDPGPPPGSYPERARAAFARRLDAVCRAAGARSAAAVESRLRSFYREHLAWRWPYSDEPGAPAVPRSTLGELLRRTEGRKVEELSPDLKHIIEPWRRNRGGEPVLELAVEWRTAPERERNAEHLVSYRLDGMKEPAGGHREWRYGDRLRARLRLAKNSPLRFAGGAAEASIPIGEGSWVRSLATGAAAATFVIEAPVTGAGAKEGKLRISATLRVIREPRATRAPVRVRPPRATTRPIQASRGPLAGLP